jgi:hypothetical protein
MTKVLSYSLFGDPSSFEFGFYLRGIYFNARMNRILYPDFETNVMISKDVSEKYHDVFMHLGAICLPKFGFAVFNHEQRCKSMLERMALLFWSNPTHVICRDADSVPTYREANCVYEWLESGLPYHAINDNDAHGGLMGGLVGFRTEDFKRDTGYTSFDQMIKGQDLRQHGSDQNFMNKHIHPKIKKGLMMHKLKGAGIEAKVVKTQVKEGYVDKKLRHSDLISRYIGSAGVIDFELLRWFKANDPNPEWDKFERKFPDVFYWAR